MFVFNFSIIHLTNERHDLWTLYYGPKKRAIKKGRRSWCSKWCNPVQDCTIAMDPFLCETPPSHTLSIRWAPPTNLPAGRVLHSRGPHGHRAPTGTRLLASTAQTQLTFALWESLSAAGAKGGGERQLRSRMGNILRILVVLCSSSQSG